MIDGKEQFAANLRKKEAEKMERVKAWYNEGRDAGFTDKQLDFLKDYFAFWNDVPKQLDDLL